MGAVEMREGADHGVVFNRDAGSEHHEGLHNDLATDDSTAFAGVSSVTPAFAALWRRCCCSAAAVAASCLVVMTPRSSSSSVSITTAFPPIARVMATASVR